MEGIYVEEYKASIIKLLKLIRETPKTDQIFSPKEDLFCDGPDNPTVDEDKYEGADEYEDDDHPITRDDSWLFSTDDGW